MNKQNFAEALKKVRESKKRNFQQSIDLIINLKDLDLKKPDQQVDFFIDIPRPVKKKKICALISGELQAEAEAVCDKVVLQDDFARYAKDKKITKKLAEECDYFIAQANIMAQVAGAFGKILGTRGKMPNPKAGCVVPPKTVLRPLYEKLQKTTRIIAKNALIVRSVVGTEKMSDDEILDNIMTIYDQLIHHLPGEEGNIKSAILKTTMGAPVKVK